MYPKLKAILLEKDSLNSVFKLFPDDLNIINSRRKSSHRLGFALLLKCYLILGYPPERKSEIPPEVVDFVALQLGIDVSVFTVYSWKNSTWYKHLDEIRRFTGYSVYSDSDSERLTKEIIAAASIDLKRIVLVGYCIESLKELKIELPSEEILRQLVNKSRRLFLSILYAQSSKRLTTDSLDSIDRLLSSDSKENSYLWLKQPTGKVALKTLLDDLKKVELIRKVGIDSAFWNSIHANVRNTLYRRVLCMNASRLRELKPNVRHCLISVFLFMKKKEIIDSCLKLFLELVRKIDKACEKKIERQLSAQPRKTYNKNAVLKKVSQLVVTFPEGSINETILSVISYETFIDLLRSYEEDKSESYDSYRLSIQRHSYVRGLRRLLKPILDNIPLTTNNVVWQPVLEGLDIVREHLNRRQTYLPESVYLPEELLTGQWSKLVYEKKEGRKRLKKHHVELCVLEKVERGLKCKEIWSLDAFKFCNPDDDLPKDWEENSLRYYKRLKLSTDPDDMISRIKKQLEEKLDMANRFFTKHREDDVYIFHQKDPDKGYFRVPKIMKRKERPILEKIKNSVLSKWGIHSLLDILVEADREVQFSRFFTSNSERQMLKDEDIRERLLLSLFSLGTNTGLKRVHSASEQKFSYEDLFYFKSRYLHPDAIREAITALTNRILSVRKPEIWGDSTVCASDGKQFESWDLNLLAKSNPHYQKRGVMVYWHVITNAICIFSQLKDCNSSEVAAMIRGLVHHETEMSVDSHYVDSRGQSEVAFAVCSFLGVNLRPRLKRIKYERLCLPDKESIDRYPHLKSVVSRAINWDLIRSQYDEMVKHIAAIKISSDNTESILRRFTVYNRNHPTYKAFKELGKALKTIFLCDYLTNEELRIEIHEGLNMIENWNSVNTFICYGRKSEFQTNDPQLQEMIMLSMHLLQNAVVLVNTLMIDSVIKEEGYFEKMKDEDFESLTPLYTSNVNPYGVFKLDLSKPSFLEAA